VLGVVRDGLVLLPKAANLLIEPVRCQGQPEGLLLVGRKGRAAGFLQVTNDFLKNRGTSLWAGPPGFKNVWLVLVDVMQDHFYFLLFWRKTQKSRKSFSAQPGGENNK